MTKLHELKTNFVSGFRLLWLDLKHVQLDKDYDLSLHVHSHQHVHQLASLQGVFPKLQIDFMLILIAIRTIEFSCPDLDDFGMI